MSGEIWHIYAEGPGYGTILSPGVRAIRYGQALGGRPCSDAYLHDAPRHALDVEWIEMDLCGRMAPGAKIHHIYTHYSDSGQGK